MFSSGLQRESHGVATELTPDLGCQMKISQSNGNNKVGFDPPELVLGIIYIRV